MANKLDLNNKSVLITGGTGSLGKELTRTILHYWPRVKRLVILSRDEQKQFQMSQEFSNTKYSAIRYFVGDIRDYDRLISAFVGIEYVIHTAAMKHVPICEYNPIECIKTNVLGAENVINACLATKVKNVIGLSTDKASAPINLYGVTKLCSDKLFVTANNIKGMRDIKFSVVRYGNVMGSTGSVIPFFLNCRKTGVLPITDPAMTRFNISLQEGVEMIFYAMANSWGGEIFVPKTPSYKITDIAKAIGPECVHKIIGIRAGEKIHEDMITSSDSFYTYDLGKCYSIIPPVPVWNINEYKTHFNARPVSVGFQYNSGQNTEWIGIEELQLLIRKHINSDFFV